VVNAAGAWADAVAAIFGAAPQGLVPYRRTAAVVDVGHPLAADQPMVAAADDSFYYRPEGGQVLISPSEKVASAAEDARPRPGDVEAVIGLINRMTTMDIRSVARSWTGLRTEPADGHPVVGFDGTVPGFFWLAGQGGYGFQTSCGIAELATGLLLGRGFGTCSPATVAALSPLR
jgi:glycine/D-amino acid oxidase-like deaminating enzyme